MGAWLSNGWVEWVWCSSGGQIVHKRLMEENGLYLNGWQLELLTYIRGVLDNYSKRRDNDMHSTEHMQTDKS